MNNIFIIKRKIDYLKEIVYMWACARFDSVNQLKEIGMGGDVSLTKVSSSYYFPGA